ncbi:Uncharacterised protein [Fusobacterium necrogenes]|uniref:Uncharacterized protein n=1 Tax=Fusobacterium necrogenes TaxID=858 RepID=A0A377GXF6_9FUSO|nr:hypothetical protein [Fusobacterium necrogenes]STO31677.1 Uncharacterised protein [Fusobacterium necrogenes]
MTTVREYILLSVLSYYNFTKSQCGKTLKEVFESFENNPSITETFSIFLSKNRKIFYEYYKKILKSWKIYYVDNRTASSGKEASGFYSVVFEKDETYVVAYRGSEKFPLEDAYKDFIETDLAIGLGKIPQQFYEGVEVYQKLIKIDKIPHRSITLTGHSLGGGIAQYVALSIDRKYNVIPYTYTWNAIGINREGIVSVLDYINLDKILKERTDLKKEEREIFSLFNQSYLEFLAKELKRVKAIKDTQTILVEKDEIIFFDIDEGFIKRLLKTTNLEKCMMKLPLERRKSLILKQNFFDRIFQLENMGELLEKAENFIKRVNDNVVYKEYIFNFGHSQDLTFSLFRHLGVSYLVDENFNKRVILKNSFFNNFKIFTKSIQNHHFENVFLPFIATEGEREGNFTLRLNLDFVASSIRKLFTMEYCLEKRLLANYYSLISVDENNFKELQNDILNGLSSSGVNLLYKKQIVTRIRNMGRVEFSRLWEKVKIKLPSPYRNLDIYDIFIFNN